MEILLACKKATEYGGEKYISSIIRINDEWIFGLCDKEGHDLFVSPVVVNIISEEVSDYSNLEDENEEYIEEQVPDEYCSDKRKIILAVKEWGQYENNCIDLMDCIYEKYNLYDISKPEAFGVLNYYMTILKDIKEISPLDGDFEYIYNDSRKLIDLIDDSRSFQFVPNSFVELKNTYERLIENAYCVYMKIELFENNIDEVKIEQLISEANSSVKNTIYCCKQLNDDLNEMVKGINYELEYIRGGIQDISEAVKKRLDSGLYSTSFGDEISFGKNESFSNQKFVTTKE